MIEKERTETTGQQDRTSACGARSPFGETCELPLGHDGWHREDRGSWSGDTRVSQLRAYACEAYARGDREAFGNTLDRLCAIADSRAAITQPAATPTPTRDAPCVWTPDEDGIYETTCGNRWFFDTGTATENGARFCPYCGAPLADSQNLES